VNRSYTLKDFLTIGGIDLKHKNVAISIDGKTNNRSGNDPISNQHHQQLTVV
jgi:hypothetical protein